jgi:hypothetical protein
MIKVKLSFPYPEWDLIRQTPASKGIWKDYKFYINETITECDYWFVFDHLLTKTENTICAKENIVLLTAEPFSIQGYDKKFTNQFGHIITCQQEIRHPKLTRFLQGHPWFVGAEYREGKYQNFSKGYDELIDTVFVNKTKQISIITSDKLITDGHKKRYEFALALKDYFGSNIDLFGRGVHDFADKWDVLADYKYSIAIENSCYPDYVSEKIMDCYLAHTFPIYYGSPNVGNYFSKQAFQSFDILKIDDAKGSIEQLLNDQNHYRNALSELIKAKNKCLNEYNLFPLIVNFIEQKLKANNRKKANITLKSTFSPTIKDKIVNKIKSLKFEF